MTYVISDFPELFLFSATYLMTAFQNARVAFWGEEPIDRLFDRWRDLDFIFLPNTALAELRPERLDLTINMVSFQEMTDAQVAAYVRRAFDLKCPFLYKPQPRQVGLQPRDQQRQRDHLEALLAA